MSYDVKEIYYTLQGEGFYAGRAAVFCRFTRCNLWSGREPDRKKAPCYFCDTDFVGTDGPGGGSFDSSEELACAIKDCWSSALNGGAAGAKPFVVFTGGEPLLQLDTNLLQAIKTLGFETAVETNGTIEAPEGIDWLTVSPKPNSKLVQTSGDELKLVFPHEISPQSVSELEFRHYYVSPMDTFDVEKNKRVTDQAVEFCRAHPKWKLSLQQHKIWGIP